MGLFSSILCCTSDITSDNIDNDNSGNNRNRNSHIRTDNKDYSKKVSVYKNTNNNNRSIQNKEMMSKRNKNRNNRNIDKPVIGNKEQQSSEKNTKSETKFMKMGSTKDDNDVILADIEYADEEKDYEDSDDMDIDDEVALIGGGSNNNYKTKLNSNENQNDNNNSNSNNNYDTNNNNNDDEYLKNKEKHTINVYTNETDRSTGSSDYGYMHQQQQQQLQQENLENELSQLTTISSNENDIPSSNIVSPSPIINSTSKTLNANNEINNNIHENNINTEPVISTTLTISDTNTTINLPSPISSSDQNDISTNSNNSSDDIDYDMIHPFDENEEFVDLTMLQPNQYHAPGFNTLLSPKDQIFKNKKLLVLDLDETLVHSSFKYLRSADFVLPVDIDDQMHNVYVIKRPGVDEFLKKVGELFEVVVFTASVNRYGDPLLDILDKHKSIHHRLFREACYNYEGNYIKNLSQLGRPLSDIIILDNSPASYIFHPQHAIPISSWFSDTHDNELLDIIPLLEDLAKQNIIDVGKVLDVSI